MTCIYFVNNEIEGRPCVTVIPRAEIRRVNLDPLAEEQRLDEDIEEDPDNERLFIHVWIAGCDEPFAFSAYRLSDDERLRVFEELAYNDFDGDVTYTTTAQGSLVRSEGRPERKLDRSYVKAVS